MVACHAMLTEVTVVRGRTVGLRTTIVIRGLYGIAPGGLLCPGGKVRYRHQRPSAQQNAKDIFHFLRPRGWTPRDY